MDSIDDFIKKNQWLAKERFSFSQDKGVAVGTNIFDDFKFQVCKFTLFEKLISELDNDSLCQAFDFFESERLRARYQSYLKKETPSINTIEKIVHLYVEALLRERVARHSNDIPSVRSEISTYSRMFPNLNSKYLIDEFCKSKVIIESN